MDLFQQRVSRVALAALLGALIAASLSFPGLGGGLSAASAQVAAPELEPNAGWLHTDRPLRLDTDLKGHVVLLDFWTYCCINCMHVLPDLEYLEEKYADEPFLVVGVHSAKFENESDRASVRHAMHRYDIHHPVVIDKDMQIWSQYGVRAWPSFVLIAADGTIVGIASGEGKRDILDGAIDAALRDAREKGTLADKKVEFDLEGQVESANGLSYPGKLLAVGPEGAGRDGGYLFIADSSHDRVLVCDLPDESGNTHVLKVFGDGERGLVDGSADVARFNDPQGMAWDAENKTLYVADTRNHTIRTIDLNTDTVATAAGTGEQGYDRTGGKAGTDQKISSPWDLVFSPDGGTLFIAMAGPHQLWAMDMASGEVGAVAGGRGENIVDGPAPQAQLAQPSALALSEKTGRLYFADSETSAVRYLDLKNNSVQTIIGTGLFDFGDIDGQYPTAMLQHNVGLTLWPTETGEDRLVVADTYNDKIKIVNPEERHLSSWLGVTRGDPAQPGELKLAEPTGVHFEPETGAVYIADTNNNRVVRVDPETGEWAEVLICGLDDPGRDSAVPDGAIETAVALKPGSKATLTLDPAIPDVEGRPGKLSPDFPVSVRVTALMNGTDPDVFASVTTPNGSLPVKIAVPGAGVRTDWPLIVELSYAA